MEGLTETAVVREAIEKYRAWIARAPHHRGSPGGCALTYGLPGAVCTCGRDALLAEDHGLPGKGAA